MNSCTICQLPVLELEGQFENLEPYYAAPDHSAAELAGECHSSCIAGSEYGRTWYEWRVRGYSTARGYRIVAEQDGWSVLVHSRHPEFLAFHINGCSVGGDRSSKSRDEKVTDGGLLVSIDEEFNFACNDAAIIDKLKARLKRDGNYPITKVLDALGISARVKWPEALHGAVFLLDQTLQRDWTATSVGMRASYAKFLPQAVVSIWRRL